MRSTLHVNVCKAAASNLHHVGNKLTQIHATQEAFFSIPLDRVRDSLLFSLEEEKFRKFHETLISFDMEPYHVYLYFLLGPSPTWQSGSLFRCG